MTFKELEVMIEDTRQKMYKLYFKNPQGPQVLRVSQQLDSLLNKRRRMIKNKSSSNTECIVDAPWKEKIYE